MARSDGRITPGEPLGTAISARAWNRAQDAADIVLGQRRGFASEGMSKLVAPYTWVYAKNTGATVARWGVVAIAGVTVAPSSDSSAASTKQFETMPVLSVEPVTTGQTGKRCVAIEPIAADKIGRIAVAGAVQVKASDLSKVTNCVVLWEDSNWALVVLNSGGGVRIGKYSGAWPKGSSKTVTFKDSTEEVDATNVFFDIAADCGERQCAVTQDGNDWYLIAAEC